MLKQKKAALTRERIIKAGAHLFSTQGFHQTSSKKIAREADLSIGSFYNHFKDKKELFLTIYQQHVTEVHQLIFKELNGGDFFTGSRSGKDLVRMIISQTMALHTLSPEFHKELNVMRYSDKDVERLVTQENERVIEVMVKLLTPHQEELRVRDLEAAAHVVVSAVEEVVHSILLHSTNVDQDRLLDALADMIYRYLYR